MNDDPSTYDQEDDAYDIVASIDWEAVRAIQQRQIADLVASMDASLDERRRGIPPLEEGQKRVVRDMAVEARRGWRYDPSERA